MQTESILEKGYDLMKYYVGLVGKFPKHQRFLIGDRVQTLAMDILGLLSEAYYLPAQEKKDRLQQVNNRSCDQPQRGGIFVEKRLKNESEPL